MILGAVALLEVRKQLPTRRAEVGDSGWPSPDYGYGFVLRSTEYSIRAQVAQHVVHVHNCLRFGPTGSALFSPAFSILFPIRSKNNPLSLQCIYFYYIYVRWLLHLPISDLSLISHLSELMLVCVPHCSMLFSGTFLCMNCGELDYLVHTLYHM